MKLKSFTKYLTIFFLLTGVTSFNSIQPSLAEQSKGRAYFFCGKHNGKPATIARHHKRGDITLVIWSLLDFGDNYPPDVRCRLVSERFERTNINGSLNYIVSGTLNNYPVLCASPTKPTNEVIDCPDEKLLMTLLPGQNSQDFIDMIADLNGDRSTDPVAHSADILQESPNGELVGINVGVMLRYSEATEIISEPKPDPEVIFPDEPDPIPTPPDVQCLFGICK